MVRPMRYVLRSMCAAAHDCDPDVGFAADDHAERDADRDSGSNGDGQLYPYPNTDAERDSDRNGDEYPNNDQHADTHTHCHRDEYPNAGLFRIWYSRGQVG